MRTSALVWVGLMLIAAIPALADTGFRVHVTPGERPAKPRCDIRLRVNGEAEMSLHLDSLRVHTIEGQDARDDGSECSAPLPDRPIEGFKFEVKSKERHADVRLLAEPDRNNDFTAKVRIRGEPGSYGRYHFRLTWTQPEGAFVRNNAERFSGRGRGEWSLNGGAPRSIRDVTIDIDRGGRVQAAFRGGKGPALQFQGTVMERDRETIKADVMAEEPGPRVRGTLSLSLDAGRNVYRIRLEATDGRDRLRLNWDRR
jgi:hypothetical protein